MLLTPVCVSMLAGGLALVLDGMAGRAGGSGPALLFLFGPVIPLYVILLPLFPFILRALRRGWAPPPLAIVGGTLMASAALDLVFWLLRR